MGLAEAGATVEQQRVVTAITWLLCGVPSRGACQLIAAAFDKIVEGVMRFDIAVEGFGDRRRLRPI